MVDDGVPAARIVPSGCRARDEYGSSAAVERYSWLNSRRSCMEYVLSWDAKKSNVDVGWTARPVTSPSRVLIIVRGRYSSEAESRDHTRASLSVLLSYSCTIPSFPPVRNCVGFTLESAMDVIPAGEAERREGMVCLEEYVLTWASVA